MSKESWLRGCAYEISNPGVDLEDTSRVKAVTGVERCRNASNRDEVAENIWEGALCTTWAVGVRCPERLLHPRTCTRTALFRLDTHIRRAGEALAIWVNGASKASLHGPKASVQRSLYHPVSHNIWL
jgi:hypothetical protein